MNEAKPNLYKKKELNPPKKLKAEIPQKQVRTNLTFAIKAEGKPIEYIKKVK